MKTVKLLSGILLAICIVISCEKIGVGFKNIHYSYDGVFLSFRDESGNDLVKGIAIDEAVSNIESDQFGLPIRRDLFSFEVIFPDPRMYPDIFLPEFDYPILLVSKLGNGDYCLTCYPLSNNEFNGKKIPPSKKITFKLKCPHIFGDDSEHVIETGWRSFNLNRQECRSVTFDGKKKVFERNFLSPYTFQAAVKATIILD